MYRLFIAALVLMAISAFAVRYLDSEPMKAPQAIPGTTDKSAPPASH